MILLTTTNRPLVTAMSTKMRALVYSYDDGFMSGELYSRFLDEPYRFNSLIKMINKMEDIFDELRFPMAFLKSRTFSGVRRPNEKQESEENGLMKDTTNAVPGVQDEQGSKKCTFEISVRYRQNASWQGEILWADRNLRQNFRSVLEMLKLMDEALNDGSNGARSIKWEDDEE